MDIEVAEQSPHLFIDEILVAMVAETSNVEPSPLFNWLGSVVAGIFSRISDEDHGRIRRTYGVEMLPFTFAQSSFGALRASGALSSVVVDISVGVAVVHNT